MTVTLTFPLPCKPLNLNDRQHWAQRAKATRLWREASGFAALADSHGMTRHGHNYYLPRSLVQIDIPVRSMKTRRDPSNWSPSTKAVVDGLVDAGLWPDDTSEYVATAEPVFHQGGATVTVTITPINEAAA